MKDFKHTGRGPKYGEHTFHGKHGFTGSTGKVRNVRSYAQAVPQTLVAPATEIAPPQPLKRGGAVNSCGAKMKKSVGGAANSCGTKKPASKGSSFFKDLMAKKK